MQPANKILFVRLRNEPFEQVNYVVHRLAEEWRKRGIIVEVTDRLSEATGPDVLIFPHFDLTLTPPPIVELLSRCARVINRSVTDISKRAISRHLVTAREAYHGPVIVKTSRNYGGIPEARASAGRGVLQRSLVRLARRLPWTVSGLVGVNGYRIYDHPRLVPYLVWRNPLLVVEKFLPEREGDLYCLRQYIFLGGCEINSRAVSRQPLVKSSNVIRREIIADTPAALRDFRAQLGFDYGKFDYVLHGDEAVIFDVNRTPTYDPASKAGTANALLLKLAPGIHPFLGQA
ncbi:MAG: hypothetical protein ABIW16_01720 [Sphingomicrobium sp.]